MRSHASLPRASVMLVLEVPLADVGGARLQSRRAFQSDEFNPALEGKFQLVGIEHMKNDHLMATKAEALQPALERILIVKKIADDHDDAARLRDPRDVPQRRAQVRLLRRLEGGETI